MALPRPSQTYDPVNEAQTRAEIDRKLALARSRGQDIELAPNERLIMTDTVTGDRVAISVASGVLTVTTI